MPCTPARRVRAAAIAAVASAALLGGESAACAQGSLKAQYRISMTAVTVGHVSWAVDIGDRFYSTSASGKASGILSFLVNGDGGVITHGRVENGRLLPADFTSRIEDEDGKTELRIDFHNGFAKETITQGQEAPRDRVPITDAHRRDVVDPLTAVMIPGAIENGELAASNCERTLAIFDGRRRYNLVLSHRRSERVSFGRGYAGPALVCGVVLQPIAGYRPDSMLVKYVAGRRDMELWFVPVIGTAVMAPVRILMPTAVGTLRIDAEEFTTAALQTPPPSSPVPALNDLPGR